MRCRQTLKSVNIAGEQAATRSEEGRYSSDIVGADRNSHVKTREGHEDRPESSLDKVLEQIMVTERGSYSKGNPQVDHTFMFVKLV